MGQYAMMKTFKALASILMILSSIPVLKVSAIANAPLACSSTQYSVDRITSKDQFTNLACFNENQFTEAIAAMETYAAQAPNVVVRHEQSYSPLNIVAADRAMAYSQNYTYLYSSTMDVWRNKERTQPYTYVSQANPFYYYQTVIQNKASTDTIRPPDLSVEVEINGAKGFVPLNGVDIIPLIYVENRVNNWYISFTTRTVENEYSGNIIKPNITYYEVKNIDSTTHSGNVSLREVTVRIDYALTAATYELGLAPDWLTNGIYYSADGIHFYTDMDLTQPVLNNGVVGEYYNYYQYLNLRSKTNYTGAELDAYFNYFASANPTYLTKDIQISTMKNQGNSFVNAQDAYGMNALIIYAMAAHESAYGTSNYAVNYNNLFGYGAYDSNPSNAANYSYPSVADGVNQHMGLNLRYYLDYSNYNATAGTSLFFASNIGNKGAGINTRYASDPWWSIKIAQWSFKIDRYLGLEDFNYHQIGILDDSLRTFYSNSGLSTPAYSVNTRATNYPYVITSKYNSSYYTQSTNPIVNGSIVTSTTAGLVSYDWANSIVYLGENQTSLANIATNSIVAIDGTDVLITMVENFNWIENTDQVYVSGFAALKNTNMANVIVEHTFIAINLNDETLTYSYDLRIQSNKTLNLGNGYDYAKAWFEADLDLTDLPDGDYRFELHTTAGDTTGSANFFNSLSTAPLPIANNQIIEDVSSTYLFRFNNKSKMRYELTKIKGVDLYSRSETLPSQIPSVSNITNLSMNSEILSLKGFSYILGTNLSPNEDVTQKLLLVSSLGNSITFDLPSIGGQDLSNTNNTYSNVWFENTNIDLSTLATGAYQMYILTSNGTYTDFVRIYDSSFTGAYTFTDLRTYEFKVNPFLRNTYYLVIS